MMARRFLVAPPALALLVLLAGCAADPDEAPATTGDDDVVSGAVEEILVPISDYETSKTHSAKVAEIKVKGQPKVDELARCHQYNLELGRDFRDIIVCRDGAREVLMDAEYGDDFARWARVRTKAGSDQFFLCKQVSKKDFSPYFYGGTSAHACKPKAASAVDAHGKALFAKADAEPTLDEFPTRHPYLPTFWKKAPAESWSTWSQAIAKALPVGEYTGYGSTQAKRCKVKVAKEGDGFAISIHALDAAGNETRTNGRLVVSSAATYGAMKKDGVPQKVSSATRPATVLLASSETETRTTDYYQRTLRVVRYPDAPASVEAGHTAVYVDDDYCQRLDPKLPAF